MISLIQHLEADFLWKVSLKILNSGIILKTFTHVHNKCRYKIIYSSYFLIFYFFFFWGGGGGGGDRAGSLLSISSLHTRSKSN